LPHQLPHQLPYPDPRTSAGRSMTLASAGSVRAHRHPAGN
jgi:hypothetical protein